ncbi:MAG TPA: Rrf2 family transcriptional regulator [Pirellulales bacterium]|jgi:Rrf2 family protein|nr:Rrf2 family transcriptional regulator [Pirellulales bacterium]
MKLTRSVGYAVGILLRVEAGGAAGPMTADAISKGCKFPPRFLYRVLRRLVDAGLLQGVSGPRGGYSLAKKPRQISVLDVILAVDEADDGPGLVPVQKSHQPAIAFINEICRREMERFRREMDSITLARLRAEKDRKRRPAKRAKRKPARAKVRGAG